MPNKNKSSRKSSPIISKSSLSINPKFKNIYFTQQEAHYIYQFLQENINNSKHKVIDKTKKNRLEKF